MYVKRIINNLKKCKKKYVKKNQFVHIFKK